MKNFLPFSSNLKLLSANPFSLKQSKIWRVGKSLSTCITNWLIFNSPEHKVLRVSYCDYSPSIGVRLSVRHPFTFPCLHSSIYKYQPISTKLGPYVYDHKISDEFNYGTNETRTVQVVCP